MLFYDLNSFGDDQWDDQYLVQLVLIDIFTNRLASQYNLKSNEACIKLFEDYQGFLQILLPAPNNHYNAERLDMVKKKDKYYEFFNEMFDQINIGLFEHDQKYAMLDENTFNA